MFAVIENGKMDQGNALLSLLRAKHPEYHPIMAIANIAHDIDASLDLQFNCHKTIAKYILPELKSVEVNLKTAESRRVTVSLFDNDIIQEAELIEDTVVNLSHIIHNVELETI